MFYREIGRACGAALLCASVPAVAGAQSLSGGAGGHQRAPNPAFVSTSAEAKQQSPSVWRAAAGTAEPFPDASRKYSIRQSPSAATRSAAMKWELGYLALSAIDAAQTISCLERGICREGNPLFGAHPKASKLILAKLGLGAVHFGAFTLINQRNPKAALRVAQISAGVQGGVVLLNSRFAF